MVARAPKSSKPARPRRPKSGGDEATGHDLVELLDRRLCERVIIETLNALMSRTARPDGKRCVAFSKLDLGTQFAAARAYLLEHRSASEVYNSMPAVKAAGVAQRGFQRWVTIVKSEYSRRVNAALAASASAVDLARLRGDLAALSAELWSMLVEKVVAFLAQFDYGELDNTTRHLLQRVAEGSTDMAKVQTEVEKTRLQTVRLRQQLRDAAADVAGKSGTLSLSQLGEVMDELLGLRREVAS